MNYYSKDFSDGASLRISPLTTRLAQNIYTDFDHTSKYCLYRKSAASLGGHKIEVLASIPDDDAAFQLSLLLGLD